MEATPSNEPRTVAERLKLLRSYVPNLSSRKLDALAGLHQGHTWQIEHGNRENLERDTAAALASVFGCTLDWLLLGKGPAPAAEDARACAEKALAELPSRDEAAA